MRIEKISAIKSIRNHFKTKDMGSVKEIINTMDTFEAADVIEVLEPEKQVTVFRLLAKEHALEVFEHLDVHTQQSLLQNFTDENAVEVFSSLEPDDRIKLIDELPAAVAKRLLSSLTQEEREMTSLLLGYKHGTAGQIMTPKYIRLSKEMSVQQAIEKVRASGKDLETVNLLYVTDDKRKLEGSVSLSDIVMAQPEEKINNIMEKEPARVYTETDDGFVAELLKESDLISVPVLDSEDRLVGVVTVDDAIDILEEEALDEVFDKAGFVELTKTETDRSKVLIHGTIPQVWRVRIPFLIITLIGGMLAGGVIEYFEDFLDAIVAVAFFVPVIMDMGGNVGTQSSTIFTRALVLGQIDFPKFLRHWGREVVIGLTMGIILGAAGGAFAAFWQGNTELGMVVGMALASTITIATALGFLVPYILVKLGFDQAAGSDPIITTIKDLSGLAIYFFLVSTFLM
ncbi:magnesium transporter [Tindallia magadiensis]|uniref:Magnesium transporter MgtE n=1 Tax=Tindallia magadiensis TaxID=69895 RepID=A0A1I3FEH0_9FIRM|nr:magnesium transporter [Tindallia magadiensis]SFI09567.1 magnesium transporter [Tindallia magadiensis]